jgi:hypothetical protein
MWCCRAAGTHPSPFRTRILSTLNELVFQPRPIHPIRSPIILQSLCQTLASLQRTSMVYGPVEDADAKLLWDMMARLQRGDGGALTAKDLTDEYGVHCVVADEEREGELRKVIITEGVVRCMQSGLEGARRWALHNLVEVSDLRFPC